MALAAACSMVAVSAHVLERGKRHVEPLSVDRAADFDQPLGPGHSRHAADEHGVDDAEHGGVAGDPDRQTGLNRQRVKRAARHGASDGLHVLAEDVEHGIGSVLKVSLAWRK
jgi:hypothetical protein